MNEASFSKYLAGHLKKLDGFIQRLEVTTGAGVPDMVLLHSNQTHWIELKWKTKHIRPEQYVWGIKAKASGVTVNYLVGYENSIELYNVSEAIPMARSWKLTELTTTTDRTKNGITELLNHLL